jgi:hypothetical protein
VSRTGPAAPPKQCIIGYAPFSPFTSVAPDSSGATIAAGLHRYALGPLQPGGKAYGGSSAAPRLVLHKVMPLDWRRLLGDHIEHSLETPTVQFELQAPGRPGMLPLAPGALLAKLRAGQQQLGSPAKQQQVPQQVQQAPAQPATVRPPPEPKPPTPPAAHPPMPPMPPPPSALSQMPAQEQMPPLQRSAMQVRWL